MSMILVSLLILAVPAGAQQEFNVTAPVKIKLGGLMQARYSDAVNSAGSWRAGMARLKTTAVTPELPQLSAVLQLEFADSPPLLDLYFEWSDRRGLPEWLRWKALLGQYRPPFSREHLDSEAYIPTLSRSAVVDALAPGRDTLSRGREFGGHLELYASPWERPDLLVARAGLFDGEGKNTNDRNDQKDLVGRVELRPAAFLTLAGSTVQGRRGSPRAVKQRNGWDAEARYGPLMLAYEQVYGTSGNRRSKGQYVLATVWLWKETLQAVYRYDWYDPDLGRGGDRSYTSVWGFNWHLSRNFRLSVNNELRREDVRVNNDTILFAAQYSFL